MSSWPKIIRDPVHNLIAFDDNDCDRLLLGLINTKEFQRLRRIKQLGFSHLTFPGADHSRFAHSIGVMHVARRLLHRVSQIRPGVLDEERKIIVLVAALLHDVGHGPFSHAFEKITRSHHEARTLEIIRDPATEIHQVLLQRSGDLPDSLRGFFEEDADQESQSDADIPHYLKQVVSSQLDADRFDYLLRDSYATGSDSGRFDMDWLIQHLELDEGRGRFYLQAKGLFAAEAYVFARYHMYRTVYFHKATRAAEVMLKKLFGRYKERLANVEGQDAKYSVVPEAPRAVCRAFSTDLALDEYLQLDDHTMTEFAKACRNCDDPILATLAQGLLDRKLFKAVDVTGLDQANISRFYASAREIVQAKSPLTADWGFDSDSAIDTAYKLYNPDQTSPPTQIYVETNNGPPRELSRLSENVANLTKPYQILRYYFPESVREQIMMNAVPILQGK
jgi:HD superfamily phosphohydrolase